MSISGSPENTAHEPLREEHGRTFNTLQKIYFLPSDEIEWKRLDNFHKAFKSAFGLYPEANDVEALLMDVGSEKKRILDIGSGSGAWALEMAFAFPNCEVLGIDLAPYALKPEQIPNNLQFERFDINDGLQRFHRQFDLVHMSMVGSGIKNFAQTRFDVEECLKPGGLVVFIDGDWRIYAEDRINPAKLALVDENGFGDKALNKREQRSWIRKTVDVSGPLLSGTLAIMAAQLTIPLEARAANRIAGADYDVDYVSDNGVWDHPLISQDTARSASIFLPIGAWVSHPNPEENRRLHDIGQRVCDNFLSVHRAYHPCMLRNGVSQEVLDHWAEMADDDLITINPPTWVRFAISWGRRCTTDSDKPPSRLQESSVLPPVTLSNPEVRSADPYPYLYIFKTKEAADEDRSIQMSHRGEEPTPFVEHTWRKMREKEAIEDSA